MENYLKIIDSSTDAEIEQEIASLNTHAKDFDDKRCAVANKINVLKAVLRKRRGLPEEKVPQTLPFKDVEFYGSDNH